MNNNGNNQGIINNVPFYSNDNNNLPLSQSPVRQRRVFTPTNDQHYVNSHGMRYNSMMNKDNQDSMMSMNVSPSKNSHKSSSPELSASPVTPQPNHLVKDECKYNMNMNMNINNMNFKQEVVMSTIIFDYDNTIFPTFYLRELFKRVIILDNGIIHNPIKHPKKYTYQELLIRATCQELDELKQLSRISYNMLYQYLQKYGNENIFIVSAADQSWMKHSLEIVKNIGHYKHIYDLLFNNSSTMIKIFNPSYRQLPFKNGKQITNWKYNTFCKVLKSQKSRCEQFNKNGKYNILHSFVSIGDGVYEYEAAQMMRPIDTNVNMDTFIHRIKLMHHPKLTDLITQQTRLIQLCQISLELHTLQTKTQKDID